MTSKLRKEAIKVTRTIKLVAISLALLGSIAGCKSGRMAPAQARSNIGKTATVCGKVASAKYAANTSRKPTFLNLDEPFPRQIFTVVIWGTERAVFGQPEVELLYKRICVTGIIEDYKGDAEMILKSRNQLKVDE